MVVIDYHGFFLFFIITIDRTDLGRRKDLCNPCWPLRIGSIIYSELYEYIYYFFFFRGVRSEKTLAKVCVLIAGGPRVYLRFNCRGSTIISSTSKSKKNSPRATPRLYNTRGLRDVVSPNPHPIIPSPIISSTTTAVSRAILGQSGDEDISSSRMWSHRVRVVFRLGAFFKSLFDDRN